MTRGRKKQKDSLTETVAIRINKDQKNVLKKNEWIRAEVNRIVRDHLNMYVCRK